MVSVTARKHIIAAIRRATLCSQRTAMQIVDENWYRINSFDEDLRLADVTITYTNPDDFSGQLGVWNNKKWKTTLSVPAGGLRTWATSSIEVAYAERPNPYLPSIIGTVTNARVHDQAPTCVLIDLEVPGAEIQTFVMLPLPWHTGTDLIDYARYSEGKFSNVIYQAAADAIPDGDTLPAGIHPDDRVAEFIVPKEQRENLAADFKQSANLAA